MTRPQLAGLRRAKIGSHYLWGGFGAASYFFVDRLHPHGTLLATADKGTRSALYISLATTSGALLGFAITAVVILLTIGGGRRMDWLYSDNRFGYARTILLGAIHALGAATLYYSALIVVDTANASHRLLEAVGALFLVLVVFRVLAVVRLMGDLLHIAILDRQDVGKGEPNPSFVEPV